MLITQTIEIDAPPDRVWPWIEEPERQKQWMKGLESNELTTAGPARAGSGIRMQIREGRKVATYDGRLLVHEPPRRLHLEFWGAWLKPERPMRVEYDLTPLPGDRTRLDYRAGCELRGFMKFMAGLFGGFARRQLDSFLRKLKALAEGR